MLFAFTPQGNRAACFPTHTEIRVDDPCGFQEKSKVVTLLKGVFTSYAYCCQFGVPCDVTGLNLGRVRLSRRALVEEVAVLQEHVAGDSQGAFTVSVAEP